MYHIFLIFEVSTTIYRDKYCYPHFKTFSAPTADTLFLLVLSILALESVHSTRFLYQHFLSRITKKSLNAFYHACSYAKADYSRFMNVTARTALHLIPDLLKTQPVFLFGAKEVLAYVTSAVKDGGAKRLFFSTVSPEHLEIFCVWHEKAPLNQTGSDWMQYIPLFLYSFRWNIEVSYYEQKTFWSLSSYMVRSCKGIEIMVNLINISYCAMKLLPYVDNEFAEYKDKSVQEFRFAISEGIRKQIFFTGFVQNIETQIKSKSVISAIKQAFRKHGCHL